ncbi:NitT/TauT family transport system ATP-binding protein [Tistlia consotensis]|uniref:NitT/TauT family transport system ATP-binding protein n=1 Tax=Tistlia consotensis USBA 355 TaxID=560819 RepID=A0A1Y6CPW0_9PROT|nr:nitrate/sulfonate/bicarbonate ABC transporter ATP-binding protein [Tistlia consotensis]SMF81627.1 NitT/TauT family transport system ATP-binding protein [Tistlia consotensis USBA 355]SNS24249.1 NitT/TauT family transport system ATP-binding protein [Tistlia consotensis]
MDNTLLLDLQAVRKAFPKPDGGELLVLDGIDLRLREGEIVGLLGRSGSGKSTLLRLIAGLSVPAAGSISYLGRAVTEPPPGIAMVFQSFALFPWLTVLENVELGLEALGLPREEIRRRSLDAIDLIGLDGFESAYPRELSGGMRQRVGFARALVVHPNILLMDEPFSALDVLTAETLRTDFLELWSEGQLPIKGVILVTHNIEEAVLMCDRILVFGSNPGRILNEIKVDLPQPRDRLDPGFRDVVERIYVEMTARPAAERAGARAERFPGAGIGTILPRLSSNLLSGLLEAVAAAPYDGEADLPVIAASLHMEIDHLFPAAETLQMLRFAEVAGGDIRLTPEGRRYAQLQTDERKRLFAQHLLTYVALAAHIRRVLDERPSHRAPWSRFSDELEDHMSPEAAEQTLRAVISWGRYAEAFAYDAHTQMFSLENP